MIMNIYYYLFYKIYRFTQKLGKYEVSFSAMLGLSFLLFLDINALYIILLPVTQVNFKDQYRIPLIILYIAVFIINYFLFIYKKRYKEIEKQFKNESTRNKRIGNAIVIAYIIISLLLVFMV